ncbi:NHLP family bacteriocin export ABC transporter peptidase/permease/ATPase subunit [Fusicatenibacter sp.]
MKTKQIHPMKKGIAKVPVIMQLEALECGAACLAMILAYYGKWLPLEQLRTDCGVSRNGSNAKNILRAARFHGLEAKGYRCEAETLREDGSFPCIIHWEFNHFVVLCGIRGDKVYLNDPGRGSTVVDWKTFDESFTGICLQMEPGENFVPGGKPKSVLDFAKKRLTGSRAAIIFAMMTAIISAMMNAIHPVFSRVFLDRLLTHQNPEWVRPFLFLFAGFGLIQLIMTALREIYDLRIQGKMAAVGNASYIWKVLRLPMSFFSQRMAGDIQMRQGSNASIANTLISVLTPLALNAVMMVFYLVLMIRYSWILTLVGLFSLAVNALVSNYISQKRINLTRVAMNDYAKLQSFTTAGISLVESIKASGAENGFFAKWAGYQANANTDDINFLKMNMHLEILTQIVSSLADNAVLLLGVWLTMQGQFTVGMIMAFQGFLSSFMSPASSFITAGQTLQEMRTQMERVEDVMEYPVPDIFAPEEDAEEYSKLSGKIEVKNLEFGYAPLDGPLIRDFNLTLEPGKSVAIVGQSGCGKSTMSKLLSGLYQPWKGEILFDGKPMSQIQKNVFYSSVAVVDQDVILFEDTIENNIKMWDSSIEDFEMILAARDAQLHDDIMARPKGYKQRILEGGRDFSGGQRQRMEIARVLAQDPTVVILDEATSALDSKTEYNVVRSIRDRGIACVVIAHRLSTIRSCDEIIVMDHGAIAARGTHEELMHTSPLYQELVCSE